MARPRKSGMDYFPHDTDASNDPKIELLRTLYGNDGYAFYFILLEQIYKSDNFELDVSAAEMRQIYARKVEVTPQKFEEMIQIAIKWDIFDADAYKSRGVLTSAGVKKRAAVVIEKRKKMRQGYRNSKSAKVSDDADFCDVSAAETQQKLSRKTSESTQSKVKKSKVKIDTGTRAREIREIFDFWNAKKIIQHRRLTDKMRGHINACLQDYGADAVKAAIDNYATVLADPAYWWEHRWTLDHFLTRGLDRFMTDNKPLENFRRSQNAQQTINSAETWEVAR